MKAVEKVIPVEPKEVDFIEWDGSFEQSEQFHEEFPADGDKLGVSRSLIKDASGNVKWETSKSIVVMPGEFVLSDGSVYSKEEFNEKFELVADADSETKK